LKRLAQIVIAAAAGFAAVLVAGTPAAPARSLANVYFKSPSGNIVCGYLPSFPKNLQGTVREGLVQCVIKSGLKPSPPRRRCSDGDFTADRVDLFATGRVSVPLCNGDPGVAVYEAKAAVLGYGRAWSGGGLRCTSATTGLMCTNKSGHGFLLSRERWRSF
jgi:uncharacterized protein DUF6636